MDCVPLIATGSRLAETVARVNSRLPETGLEAAVGSSLSLPVIHLPYFFVPPSHSAHLITQTPVAAAVCLVYRASNSAAKFVQ